MRALDLPQGWDSFNAAQKIEYFNSQGITPQQLLAEGVPQGDIDWMLQNGYTGTATKAAPSIAEALRAALDASDGSIAGKGKVYNDLINSGISDADLRATVDQTMGVQPDADWQYLQQIAGVQNASTKAVADKVAEYNALQQAGLDDNSIRALVTNAVGPQTDEAWNWLTSADQVRDLPAEATVKDKVDLYNSLQGKGYSDADIRNITQDVLGPQSDEAWNWLTSGDQVRDLAGNATVKDKVGLYNSLQGKGYTDADIRNITQDVLGPQTDLAWNWLTAGDKINDVLGGTVSDKAKVYNDLLSNSGLTEDQIRNVINDVAGQQTDFDMGWLKDAATIQKVSTGTAQQKADTYNQLIRAGRSPFEIRQIADSTLGQQSDSDWDALLKLANVGAATPDQQQPPTWSSGYQSNLIQSLRANNTKPFSNNPGVNLLPNPPAPEPSNWTLPLGQNSAFNPPVFNQQPATPGQISDWNAYNAYRANSVNGDDDYLSFQDWLAQRAPGSGGSTTAGGGKSNPGGESPDSVFQGFVD